MSKHFQGRCYGCEWDADVSKWYLCEQGFSALLYIKNKYRARLCEESDLCVALSKIETRIDELVKSKQAQPSH